MHLEKSDKTIAALNESVMRVIGNEKMQSFEKAYVVAEAINNLQTLLTPEYMKPIMALQGNRLGFRTDKDKNGGYPEAQVKNCLIEAVLMGLQPTGNQFNIIAGNTYPTKEGLGYLLANFPGLDYSLATSVPRVNAEKTSAAVQVFIKWTLNGKSNEQTIEIPLKIDSYSSVDAMIGKATRKGRAWLYSRISGTEITDGEIEDTDAKVISSKLKKSEEEIERERLQKMVDDCETLDDLELLQVANFGLIDAQMVANKVEQLKAKK